MKLRLLATDPDPLLLQIFRAYFPNFGYDIATARDGLECVELLHEFLPDALVLSLELLWGGADGVLSIVREETQVRPIPVVLTVGEMGRSKAVKYLLPPVVKLLEKPFRLRDLRAIVEDALHARADRLISGFDDPAVTFARDDLPLDADIISHIARIHRAEARHV